MTMSDDPEQPSPDKYGLADRFVSAIVGMLAVGALGFFVSCAGVMPDKRTGQSWLGNPDGSVSGWFWVFIAGGAALGFVLGLLFPRLGFGLGERVRDIRPNNKWRR